MSRFLPVFAVILFATPIPAASPETDLFPANGFVGGPLSVYVYPFVRKDLSALLSDADGNPVVRATVYPLPEPVEGIQAAEGEAPDRGGSGEKTGTIGVAVLAVPVWMKPGTYTVSLLGGGSVLSRKPLTVSARPYPEERIPLSGSMTTLRSAPDPKRDEESDRLYELLMRSDGETATDPGLFHRPVPASSVSSVFGSHRVYEYADGRTSVTWHYGTDYAVPVGTPVTAAGAGKVVFAGARILTGNSILIEHFPGVFSIYYHLDSLTVRAGEIVARDQPIGYSGNTGLVTGPHLHFEIRIRGIAVDPGELAVNTLIDKKRIISIMRADQTMDKGR